MSKTEVSGKQVKDGSIELVDLSTALSNTISGKAEATDVTALDTRVTAVEADVSALQSAGAPNLSDLGEVSITSPSNDQVLKYNGTAWVNAAAPAAGATDLDGLSDVAVSSAVKGQFIVHNGTQFVNSNTIEASGAAVKPLIVKGAASQTAVLFEAQNSAGTAVAQLWPSGALTLSSSLTLVGGINFGPALSGMALTTNGSYNGVALGRGSSTGESGLALGSYVSAGSNEMRIGWGGGGTGRFFYGPSTGEVGIGVSSPGAQLHAQSKSASMKGLIVQGAASQTANLFEVQDSSSTALVAVNSAGKLGIGTSSPTYNLDISGSVDSYVTGRLVNSNAGTSAGSQLIFGNNANAVGVCLFSNSSTSTAIGGAGSFNIYQAQNAPIILYTSGTERMRLDGSGQLGINETTLSAQLNITSGAAARKGLIVKAAASQTANLFEVQNSSASNFVTIDSTGMATFSGGGWNKHAALFSGAIDNIGAVATAGVYAGQTGGYGILRIHGGNGGSLFFGTHSGIYTAQIQSYGNGLLHYLGYNTVKIAMGDTHASYPGTLHVITAGAASKGLVVKGIASQSANLFEAQNSSETVLASISSGGSLNATRFVETSANAFNTSLAPSSGTLTVDSSAGNIVLGALSASVTTWAFTNVPTDNSRATTVVAVIAGNASYTYGDACSVNGSAVSGGIMWSGGSAPTATAGTDIISFIIVKDSAGTVKVFGSATTNFS